MTRLHEHFKEMLPSSNLTEIGLALESLAEGHGHSYPIYVLLTDTKTGFSKISRLVTGDPYNHVSLTFDEEFSEIYTYALVNNNGLKGGLKLEDREVLRGSRYSLYRIDATKEAYEIVREKVREIERTPQLTRYNHLGLINAIFKKDIFKSEDTMKMICSEFVLSILNAAGIQLFKKKKYSSLRPYDFVKSKLLKFVRRGVIK